MKKIRKSLISLLMLLLCGCANTNPSPAYNLELNKVKEFVKVGDDIYSAKEKLKKIGKDCSEVYDPTGLGDNLMMIVNHENLTPTGGFLYAAGINVNNSLISTVIEANMNGVITSIE
ncbi:hypothetical protein JIN85_17725 [Luteolibacter pohnpeiensis]|uniref:Uncharacterized protein n=1 Tax=Luteolibacter pohnpeiensis TaxID=454153 RepID=A0A934S9F5_9BACT|nr:hypothetical protein [Luteolibacter pohnpeiensis]MBK1884263.1 hypothetical protein [Luteolibacter pohnpeiensis]